MCLVPSRLPRDVQDLCESQVTQPACLPQPKEFQKLLCSATPWMEKNGEVSVQTLLDAIRRLMKHSATESIVFVIQDQYFSDFCSLAHHVATTT